MIGEGFISQSRANRKAYPIHKLHVLRTRPKWKMRQSCKWRLGESW